MLTCRCQFGKLLSGLESLRASWFRLSLSLSTIPMHLNILTGIFYLLSGRGFSRSLMCIETAGGDWRILRLESESRSSYHSVISRISCVISWAIKNIRNRASCTGVFPISRYSRSRCVIPKPSPCSWIIAM